MSVLVSMSVSVILNLKFTSNMLKKSIKKHDSMGDKFRIQKKRLIIYPRKKIKFNKDIAHLKQKKSNIIRSILNLYFGIITVNPPEVRPDNTMPTRGSKLITLPT